MGIRKGGPVELEEKGWKRWGKGSRSRLTAVLEAVNG
jgi:hypothetical protein